MFAADVPGSVLAIVGGAVFTVASVGGLIIGLRIQREVRTMNESTMGQLAAGQETRRVEALDHDDRTAMEQRHLDDAPPHDPPQGPTE